MPDLIPTSRVKMAPATPAIEHNVPEEQFPSDECWEIVEGDGQVPALQLIDESFDARPSPLAETNMIDPNRPVDETGIIGFIRALFGLRVSPQGKNIMDLHKHPQWWAWIVEEIGERNAQNFRIGTIPRRSAFILFWVSLIERFFPAWVGWNVLDFRIPGDGNMDTNAPDSDDLKLLSASYGGNWQRIREFIVQSGATWCVIDTMDFNSPPSRYADGWYYKGKKVTYASHPYWYVVRTNRARVNMTVWQTAGGINVRNDVGKVGGKGRERWPHISSKRVAQRLNELWILQKLPFEAVIYKNSLVEEGIRMPQTGGLLTMITKLRINGPEVHGWDSIRGKWFLLVKMLVRGSLENRDGGTGFDWRCHAEIFCSSRRYCLAPDCGWIRPK